MQCRSFVLRNIRFLLEEHGERITYFTITVLHICSTFIRERCKVLLLILGSLEGIIVYLAYIMVSLMKIKPVDPVTIQFLFMPIWRTQRMKIHIMGISILIYFKGILMYLNILNR